MALDAVTVLQPHNGLRYPHNHHKLKRIASFSTLSHRFCTRFRTASSTSNHHRTALRTLKPWQLICCAGTSFNLCSFSSNEKMEGKKKSSFVSGEAGEVPKWMQRTVTLPSHKRGCHLVTPTILKDVEADLANFKCGLAHFFLQHTSASLTINENYDSDVLDDVETWLTGTVPEGRKAPWKHTIEGPDDMPAHIKSSVFGCALSIPITDGRLNLGTWQGIWLCEHRDHASARKVVVTMTGV